MRLAAALVRVLACALCFGICTLPPSALAADEAPSISVAEVAKQSEAGSTPFLLDVRTPEEYVQGHIPGAINIPLAELEERAGELRYQSSKVVVYCTRGPRARKGEQALALAGVSRVLHLEGGMEAWLSAGNPVEKARAPR